MKAGIISLYLALSLLTLSEARGFPSLNKSHYSKDNAAINKRSTLREYTNGATFEHVIRKSATLKKRKEDSPGGQQQKGDGDGKNPGEDDPESKNGSKQNKEPSSGGLVIPPLPTIPPLPPLPPLDANGLPFLGKDALSAVGQGGIPIAEGGVPGLPDISGLPALADVSSLNGGGISGLSPDSLPTDALSLDQIPLTSTLNTAGL